MTNPFGFIAGFAVSAVKDMIEIYRRKYGKYGEAKVKNLEKKLLALASELDALASELDALHAENERLTAALKSAHHDIEVATKRIGDLEMLRSEHGPAGTENPF